MLNYQKTPVGLLKIIAILKHSNLEYNLFKCEKVFEGGWNNLDILFKDTEDYEKASVILEKNNFELYLTETVEKYKRMYVKVFGKRLYAVHIHREVAWHGIITLNKNHIFKRQKMENKLVNIPSDEDALLIHSAHILFEN